MNSQIVLTGPTASGKGAVAFELARRIGGEIVSLDSMKVYREMDIVTAKPSAERRRQVRYHLIDIIPPERHFSTGDYLARLEEALADVRSRGRVPIIAGGTALYLVAFLRGLAPLPEADWEVRGRLLDEARELGPRALHERLARVDPEAAGRLLPGDLRRVVRALEVHEMTGRPLSEQWREQEVRPERDVRLFGIAWDRPELYRRTDRRVLRMVEEGLFEEAARLLDRRPPASRSARQCIGYKEVAEGRERGSSREEVIETIQRNTRRFVKRQMTWFRKLPITWIPAAEPLVPERVAETIEELLRKT